MNGNEEEGQNTVDKKLSTTSKEDTKRSNQIGGHLELFKVINVCRLMEHKGADTRTH
jgi:hypothetical protein